MNKKPLAEYLCLIGRKLLGVEESEEETPENNNSSTDNNATNNNINMKSSTVSKKSYKFGKSLELKALETYIAKANTNIKNMYTSALVPLTGNEELSTIYSYIEQNSTK
jgi:hypothetical protein